MANPITFIVPAVPIAQPRPRATTINGSARMYDAKKSHPIHDFKASVRMSAMQAYQGKPIETPLTASMTFVMPRPKSKQWKTKPMPRYPHTGKPDCDNLAKGVLDALNGLLFRDDSQVWTCDICKLVASGDEQPHVLVSFQESEA